MTRAYTLLGRKIGLSGLFSVGRVQTPLLGLIVRRDEEIENFIPRDYYEVYAHIVTPEQQRFTAKWIPAEACQPWQDEHGHVTHRPLAEHVANTIRGKAARVVNYECKEEKEFAPLPYSLSSLQIEAAKRFNLTASQVLDICQKLYETHKLITYPRSDCRYLPEAHFAARTSVIAAIKQHLSSCAETDAFDVSLKNRCWNDKKVGAHHAIIPTARRSTVSLTKDEMHIYQLIAHTYLLQFYPHALYQQCYVELAIAGGKFIARTRNLLQPGWRDFCPPADNQAEETRPPLPRLQPGDVLLCEESEVKAKQTRPPLPFTDATLMAAMTGIARYVHDKTMKQILRETDGLGTEATRASIIELLFRRKYIYKQGRQIRASEIGRAMVHALPDIAVYPDMTAHWEAMLARISERACSYQDFMRPLEENLHRLLQDATAPSMLAPIKRAFTHIQRAKAQHKPKKPT